MSVVVQVPVQSVGAEERFRAISLVRAGRVYEFDCHRWPGLVSEALLTPAEVAALFRVTPKTVTRWARAGKITAIRTVGGHRRFRTTEIDRCLEQVDFTQ